MEEAEAAAQGYVAGTMEADGFAYDGAAVYDADTNVCLRVYGDYPDEKAQAQASTYTAEHDREAELPAVLDEHLIEAILLDDGGRKHTRQEIFAFFQTNRDIATRTEFLKSSYNDIWVEVLAGADKVRVGYHAEKDGLLMWEGSYLSRTAESVFSWGVVTEMTENLIERGAYKIKLGLQNAPVMAEQMSLFGMGDGTAVYEVPETQRTGELFPTRTVPQAVIDQTLYTAGNSRGSAERIAVFYMRQRPEAECVAFLRREFGTENGRGIEYEDQKYAVWFMEDGIHLAQGDSIRTGHSRTTVTWEQASARILELLEAGTYLSAPELEQAQDKALLEMGDALLMTARDLTQEGRAQGLFPQTLAIHDQRKGYPELDEDMVAFAKSEGGLAPLAEEYHDFLRAYEQNRSIMRFRLSEYNTHRIGVVLDGIDLPERSFTAQPDFLRRCKMFITQDEIDQFFLADSVDSKLAVYSFFCYPHAKEERQKFIKSRFGEYSGGGRDGYVDDGYSGTNFQRPSFQNMIKDIENGLINCVITKDLSRLGRNYLDCGLYLEVFFPEHNVRYIAVNDGVDTLNKSAMDITPFRNILNEMYSADVSVKIKSAYRARFQQGKFMGTTAPYGYVKDPADHNHLLIDDKVAHVVREIFDLALAGNGIAKIRKHINKQHILRPAAYAVEQGATGYERYFEDNEENRYIWSENSVRGILRSPIYAGNLAGYKRIAANMKSKKRPSKLPEEWEVIPDTHEGIVTQEEFDTVQQLMTSRRREQNAGGFENIFSGVIKCADCGYAMRAASANRRKRPDIIDCVQYTCNNYGRYGNVMCTAHSIEARDLFNAVLADINRFADMAVNDEKAVRAIERRLTETDQSRAKSLEKEKKKLNKRLAELDRLFSSLYEDKVMERITERNFEMMSGKYQKEQLEIEARLKEVTETLNDSYEKSQGVRDFLSLIRNYQGLKELDATIINALIDKILVSEREKLADGTVRQEIKIYYKFIGFVGELHITPTKRWTALKPKNCTVCGVEYVPSSGISKYCPACAKRIQREKSNESKRRSRERNRRACIELSAKNDRLISSSGRGASSGRATKMPRWTFTVTSPRVHSTPISISW